MIATSATAIPTNKLIGVQEGVGYSGQDFSAAALLWNKQDLVSQHTTQDIFFMLSKANEMLKDINIILNSHAFSTSSQSQKKTAN